MNYYVYFRQKYYVIVLLFSSCYLFGDAKIQVTVTATWESH